MLNKSKKENFKYSALRLDQYTNSIRIDNPSRSHINISKPEVFHKFFLIGLPFNQALHLDI